MQYQVPQFIEVEDKIFGPLTLRQFVYLAGGGAMCLLFVTILPLYLAIIVSLPFVALALGLAFYKVNGQPLVIAIEHAVSYYIGGKLYLWKQRTHKQAEQQPSVMPQSSAQTTQYVPRLSQSKLKDLAWSLNIKDREKMGVMNEEPTGFEL